MASEQVALVIVAGIWAALNTLVSAYQVVNDKRDVIVTGVYKGERLSLDHRRLMLRNDWIPLKFGVALTSLIFALILFAIPQLAQTPDAWMMRVSYVAALAPFFSFLGFGALGISDYRFIKNALNEAGAGQEDRLEESGQTT